MNDEINRKWYHDQVVTKVLYPKYYINNIPMPGTRDEFHMPIFDQTITVLGKLQKISLLSCDGLIRPKTKSHNIYLSFFIALIEIYIFGNARPFPLSLVCTNSRRKWNSISRVTAQCTVHTFNTDNKGLFCGYSFILCTKLYIPSTINIWKKPFGQTKNGPWFLAD